VIYLHQNPTSATAVLGLHPGPKKLSLDRERRDQRNVGVGAQILRDLNLRRIRLLTNHPRPVAALEGYGIEIMEHVAISKGQFTFRDTWIEEGIIHETSC
jgi:GTP cyclohydrolase II